MLNLGEDLLHPTTGDGFCQDGQGLGFHQGPFLLEASAMPPEPSHTECSPPSKALLAVAAV